MRPVSQSRSAGLSALAVSRSASSPVSGCEVDVAEKRGGAGSGGLRRRSRAPSRALTAGTRTATRATRRSPRPARLTRSAAAISASSARAAAGSTSSCGCLRRASPGGRAAATGGWSGRSGYPQTPLWNLWTTRRFPATSGRRRARRAGRCQLPLSSVDAPAPARAGDRCSTQPQPAQQSIGRPWLIATSADVIEPLITRPLVSTGITAELVEL